MRSPYANAMRVITGRYKNDFQYVEDMDEQDDHNSVSESDWEGEKVSDDLEEAV